MSSLKTGTLQTLEWFRIQAELEKRAGSPMGAERAATHLPFETQGEALRLLSRVAECLTLLKPRKDTIPFQSYLSGLVDPKQWLEASLRDSVLHPEELWLCAHFMESIGILSSGFRSLAVKHPELAPLLCEDWKLAPETPSLCGRVKNAVSSSGEVLDSASSELARLRSQRTVRVTEFESILETKIKKWDDSGLLQDKFYDVQDGRYVIPVKVSEQSKIAGAIVGKSNTGQSVFIEPFELSHLSNAVKELDMSIHAEILRILTDLTRMVSAVAKNYFPWIELAGELDLAFSAGRFASDFKLQVPRFQNKAADLYHLSHIALELQGLKNVVRNNIEFSDEVRAIVLSGPNTGGKTVLLKAVGVAACMAKAGLPIPTQSESQPVIPFYDDICAMIGDDQNIAQGLSSFSAQIQDMKRIIGLKGHALVLVDEILSSTDPEEASALAQALIEEFIERNHHVFITTHFTELSLKIKQNPHVLLAGMEFHGGEPTYRILKNELGSSHAIEVAKRLGLPEKVLVRARSLVSNIKLEYQNLQKELRDKEYQMRAEHEKALVALADEKIRLKQDFAERLKDLETATDGAMAEAREKFQKTIEDLTKRVQTYSKIGAPRNAKEKIESAAGGIIQEFENAVEDAKNQIHSREKIVREQNFEVGSAVKVVSMGNARGEILELDDAAKTALIQVGNFKLTKPLSDLVIEFTKPNPAALRKLFTHFSSDVERVPSKIDLRGKRLDDAIAEAEKMLDQGFRSGMAQLTLITGHGTGVIKNAVKDLLKSLPYVREFRPERASDDGAFIVEFDY